MDYLENETQEIKEKELKSLEYEMEEAVKESKSPHLTGPQRQAIIETIRKIQTKSKETEKTSKSLFRKLSDKMTHVSEKDRSLQEKYGHTIREIKNEVPSETLSKEIEREYD